ncbi:MAG TPA: cytochrome b/b6 domain-containing protein [Acidimicrobiia bacterium]|nr:cytochrome b/b6 domain-containing protein [Acidimicrobiia bacterium]
MGATTARPEPAGKVVRFDRVERATHWSTALVVFVLIGTAAVLYVPALSAAIGRRDAIRRVHTDAGFCLPLPLLLGLLLSRRSGSLSADLRGLGRWSRADRSAGRFNAGQKLFGAFAGGAGTSMLVTGSMLHWYTHVPLRWRTGATFTHDTVALAIAVAVAGHVAKAVTDPAALAAMVLGTAAPSRRDRRRLGVAAAVTVAALAVGAGVARHGPAAGPATVAVRWEEAVDRGSYERLPALAGTPRHPAETRAEFLRRQVADLTAQADDKGDVVAVTVAGTTQRAGRAVVVLTLRYVTGSEVPQEVGLRRAGGRWRVVGYPLSAIEHVVLDDL